MNSYALKVLLTIVLVASSFVAAAGDELPKGYESIKKFKLDSLGDGLKGTIQLFVDKSPKRKRNGILKVVSSDRKVLFSKLLRKPGVDLSVFYSQPGEKTLFFLTEDWTADFGSYSGPITSIISIVDGTPREMEARDETGSYGKISLMRSLKTAWKPILNRRSTPQILKVSCRPDFETKNEEEMRFKTTYSRFIYKVGKWQLYERQLAGVWEDEGVFPPIGAFPPGSGE